MTLMDAWWPRLLEAEFAPTLGQETFARLRDVIERRFGLAGEHPQTLEQIGKELGITRERVRQLETRALKELRRSAPELGYYLIS